MSCTWKDSLAGVRIYWHKNQRVPELASATDGELPCKATAVGYSGKTNSSVFSNEQPPTVGAVINRYGALGADTLLVYCNHKFIRSERQSMRRCAVRTYADIWFQVTGTKGRKRGKGSTAYISRLRMTLNQKETTMLVQAGFLT